MSGLLLLKRPLHVRCLSSRLSQVRRYALIGKPKGKGEPTWALPSTPARTRFAPSPTGYLHLGSMRTALFNYLLAQATGGQFILRLEDTDQTRFVHDAEERLYEDLRWAGLEWDEGPDKGGEVGPYKQSERLDVYRQHAHQLLESGHAFRCFCSKEDLEFNIMQATASGEIAHYPGTCLGIGKDESDRRAAVGEPHTIRFKASETPVTALDLVYGTYKKAEREDKFIIMKSDGFPTYHFANVVDDHLMKITHVIRGAEWLISTPKHVELYNAFGWQAPHFAHVGLLVDQQRQKLSKRDMDNIGISIYRKHNILPAALLNFSVLLGWDPKLQDNPHLDKRGAMTVEDMKNNFTLKFTRGDIVVDLTKLKYFQSRLIRDLLSGQVNDPAAVSRNIVGPIMSSLEKFQQGFEKYQSNRESVDESSANLFATIRIRETHKQVTEDDVLKVLQAWKGTVDAPSQFAYDNIHAFYPIHKNVLQTAFLELQESIQRVRFKRPSNKGIDTDISTIIHRFRIKFSGLDEDAWTTENLGDLTKELVDAVEYYDPKKEQVMNQSAGWKLMRWGLLAGKPGLSILPLMELWGRKETVARLKLASKVAAFMETQLLLKNKESMPSEQATEVRIRYKGGPREENAKQDSASHRKEPKRTTESRRVRIQDQVRKRLQQQEEVPKGPFVSRPPMPPPEKSPKRSPKEVERSPQFLDDAQFSSGHRRLHLDKIIKDKEYKDKGHNKTKHKEKQYAPAFGDLRKGKRLDSTPQGQDPRRAAHWTSPAPSNRVSRPWLKPMHSDAPSNESIRAKRGPFFVGEPIEDLKVHVAHLQALNIALKKKKAKSRTRSDNLVSAGWRHLKDPESLQEAPIYLGKALGMLPSGVASGRVPVDARKAMNDSEREKPQVHLPTATSGTMANHVKAMRRQEKAKELVSKQHDESMDELERALAARWKERD